MGLEGGESPARAVGFSGPPERFSRPGLLVKLAATGKEFVLAGIYGRSDAMDAFLAAFLIPNLLINLIAESMNQALIPTLIRVRIHEGRERRTRAAGAVDALAVHASHAGLAGHGSDGPLYFSADRFRIRGGQAGSLDPAVLRASARGASHRHRVQLYRGIEYRRPVCAAGTGSDRDPAFCRRRSRSVPCALGNMGAGLRHVIRRGRTCGDCRLDDVCAGLFAPGRAV